MTTLSKYTFDRFCLGICLRKQTAFLGIKAICSALFQLRFQKCLGKKSRQNYICKLVFFFKRVNKTKKKKRRTTDWYNFWLLIYYWVKISSSSKTKISCRRFLIRRGNTLQWYMRREWFSKYNSICKFKLAASKAKKTLRNTDFTEFLKSNNSKRPCYRNTEVQK